MTEDDIRRIVREEIAKSQAPRDHYGLVAFPVQPLPMPKYHYQPIDYSPPVSSGHPPSSLKGVAR